MAFSRKIGIELSEQIVLPVAQSRSSLSIYLTVVDASCLNSVLILKRALIHSMTNRGGKRENAGRPRGQGQFGEPTIAIRIPQSQEPVIRNFLSTLIAQRTQRNQDTVTAIFALSPAKQNFLLPLYTSKVVAGFPSPADDHVEKRLNPNDYLISNDSSTFFVQVKGDSMVDAGIFEKDVLVVDRSRTAQTGDIVLAVLDGEFTIKILGQSETGTCLIPANKNYPVIQIKENQSFEVWGVITGSMRKFK